MSKEIFLMPSAKQILNYENGDIRSDEVSSIFRFHFMNVYIWIEPSKRGYDITFRGRFCRKDENTFVSSSRVIISFSDLDSAIYYFKRIVQDYILLHDLFLEDSSDFEFEE